MQFSRVAQIHAVKRHGPIAKRVRQHGLGLVFPVMLLQMQRKRRAAAQFKCFRLVLTCNGDGPTQAGFSPIRRCALEL